MKPETQTPAVPDARQSQHNRCEMTLLSISQTAQLSGVSQADLLGLVKCGALAPTVFDKEVRMFDVHCVTRLQRTARVRQNLELDSHGFAMALILLDQITRHEVPLRNTLYERHRGHSLGAGCTLQTR